MIKNKRALGTYTFASGELELYLIDKFKELAKKKSININYEQETPEWLKLYQ